MSEWVTVARAGELAPGEWRVVDVDDTQIAVFNLDGELRVTWIYNTRAALVADSAEGKTLTDVFPAELAASLTAVAREVLRSGAGSRFHHSFHTGNGLRAYDVTIEPLRDTGCEITGITGALIDITASKQVEEALSVSEPAVVSS